MYIYSLARNPSPSFSLLFFFFFSSIYLRVTTRQSALAKKQPHSVLIEPLALASSLSLSHPLSLSRSSYLSLSSPAGISV